MKKRICSLLVIFVCCLACMKPAFAEETIVTPQWEEVTSIYCTLDSYNGLLSNSKVSCSVVAKYSDYGISLTVSVQKYSNGILVDTGNSWTTSGTNSLDFNKTCSLSKGVYVAHAVAVITNPAGQYVETVTWDSAEYYVY